MSSLPIADLSYRGYDGPLEPPTFRWRCIAKNIVLRAMRDRLNWVFAVLGGGYFWVMIIVLAVMQQQAASSMPVASGAPPMPNPFTSMMDRIIWKDQFLHGISMAQMWLMFITLRVGAGSIANDNRSNALLVYLSKPCTKMDYLVGKVVGISLALLVFLALPSVVFYLYGTLSFREFGFLSNDPWIGPKLLLILPIISTFYACLSVGISSLFQQGRLAGAAFASLYLISLFVTNIMAGMWFMMRNSDATAFQMQLLTRAFYMSIDGQAIGLTKIILNTRGGSTFMETRSIEGVPIPEWWLVGGIVIGLSTLGLALAWKKIRAVEVVG